MIVIIKEDKMYMIFDFLNRPKEIKTLNDWIYCISQMAVTEVSEEDEKKVSSAVKKGIEEFNATKLERHLKREIGDIETYAEISRVYLKSGKESAMPIGYEFAKKARKTLTEISKDLSPAEAERLERLVKDNEDKITQYELQK